VARLLLISLQENNHTYYPKAENMPAIESSQKRRFLRFHKQQQCGVHEYGLNIAEAVKKSVRYTFIMRVL